VVQDFITLVIAFVATNIDDIFLLTLWYADKKHSHYQILAGQFAGIFCLVIASWLISRLGLLFDPRYIGLLGLFPIYLGMRHAFELINANADSDSDTKSSTHGVISIALVTIANGGDNVGVYVPLLPTLSGNSLIMMIIVFAVMVVLWCIIARYLAYHPALRSVLEKYAHILLPFVLIALGVYILIENDVLSLFVN